MANRNETIKESPRSKGLPGGCSGIIIVLMAGLAIVLAHTAPSWMSETSLRIVTGCRIGGAALLVVGILVSARSAYSTRGYGWRYVVIPHLSACFLGFVFLFCWLFSANYLHSTVSSGLLCAHQRRLLEAAGASSIAGRIPINCPDGGILTLLNLPDGGLRARCSIHGTSERR